MAENPLMGRVVWVTGAGRGIGRALSMALAGRGARVVLSARTGTEIEETAQAISRSKGEALALPCDVQETAAISAAHTAIQKKWGPVDVLINNAGTAVFTKIIQTRLQDWDAMMATNLRGAFLCCQAVLPEMINRRTGHIINVVSVAGRQPYYNCGAYCASKYGLMGLTEVLRMETRKHNIKVTALLPGATDTGIWSGSGADRNLMLQPEEVAESVVALLCSSSTAMIEEIVLRPPKGDLP
jgi:3-oxoacyl-[acyl-carrier protein] reductase